MTDAEAELESFRQQWREEVSARGKPKASLGGEYNPARRRADGVPPTLRRGSAGASRKYDVGDKEQGPQSKSSQPIGVEKEIKAAHSQEDSSTARREPLSALEHYEKAVEREGQGSLGDSVDLYRKAFRLDSSVHETYKNKHFPPSASKTAQLNPSSAPVTVPNTTHHASLQDLPPSVNELLNELEGLSIATAPPPTDASPAPPCPIASLPEEILVEILLHLAIIDVASYARLAQVCKRLALLVITEERIWKRVTLGTEYGFGAMHYSYACDLLGRPLERPLGGEGRAERGDWTPDIDNDEPDTTLSLARPQNASTPLSSDTSPSLFALSPTYTSYRHMFRNRPRLRFNGLYISTVNYTRPGAASPSQVSWNSPVLIVTYYRYLRFFRDGTVISLLTTAEPVDVVPVLHKENLPSNKSGGSGGVHVPATAAVMKDALRGRWRLSGPAGLRRKRSDGVDVDTRTADDEEVEEVEGQVHIETEGVVPKYMWKMEFTLGSAGRGGSRNNKLSWKGFWSYNRLTDDWGEFGLKNDRGYYWSRVKSYGTGIERA